MAKTKQKISFEVHVVNQNVDLQQAPNALIKCKLRILAIESTQTEENKKWRNYVQFLTNRQYAISLDKLIPNENLSIAMYTDENTSTPISFANSPNPIEIPSTQSIDLTLMQDFIFYLYTTKPVEDLIRNTGETPVGSFTCNLKVQLVDENEVYADSDEVNVQAVFTSGIVADKPSMPSA